MDELVEGFVIQSRYILCSVATIVLVYGIKKLANNISKNPSETNTGPPTSLEERKPSNLWNTALFFPDYNAGQRDSVAQQFMWYFAQARTSIRVCIYNFKLPELESVIVQQSNDRGSIVQFVVGHETTAQRLRLHSIPCGLLPRTPDMPATDQLMHHKFAIIDDEAVVVGSMNWTTEGILNNKENIVVSTDPRHVEKYLAEFFRLLNICEKAKTYY